LELELEVGIGTPPQMEMESASKGGIAYTIANVDTSELISNLCSILYMYFTPSSYI
jgi:hypothetical protein